MANAKFITNSKYHVIIPCAGNGSRFASAVPKQYHPLCGKTVLDWTLTVFEQCHEIDSITIITNPVDSFIDNYGYAARYSKLKILKAGGETRFASVINGLAQLSCNKDDWVLVHDAARCCLDPRDLGELITRLKNHLIGGILAQKAVDTIKQVNADGVITGTLDRNYIYLAETPQMFRYSILSQGLGMIGAKPVTDEASAVERLGVNIQIIESQHYNQKLTYPEDLQLMEMIINARLKVHNYV